MKITPLRKKLFKNFVITKEMNKILYNFLDYENRYSSKEYYLKYLKSFLRLTRYMIHKFLFFYLFTYIFLM